MRGGLGWLLAVIAGTSSFLILHMNRQDELLESRIAAAETSTAWLNEERANGHAELLRRHEAQEAKLLACERRTLHLRATLLHVAKMAQMTRLPRPFSPASWPPWPSPAEYRWDPDGFIRQTLDAYTEKGPLP